MENQTQNQTQTNPNAAERFFLPSFAKRRSSRTNAGNLATAGLFSALAACGGGDGSTAPSGPATYTLDNLVDDAVDQGQGQGQVVGQIPNSALNGSSNDALVLDDDPAVLTFTEGDDTTNPRHISFSRTSGNEEQTFIVKNFPEGSARYWKVLDLDNSGKTDLFLGISNKGSNIARDMTIVWNFAEKLVAGGGFDMSNNTGTGINGANIGSLRLFDERATGTVFDGGFFSDVDEHKTMIIGDAYYSPGQSLARYGAYYFLWNPKSYGVEENVAIDLADFDAGGSRQRAIAEKILTVRGSFDGHSIGSKNNDDDNVALAKIDDDGWQEFITFASSFKDPNIDFSPYTKDRIHVVWDISTYRDLKKTNNTGIITIQRDGVVTEDVLSIFSTKKGNSFGEDLYLFDLDGDDLIDIFTSDNTDRGILFKGYIIWGAAITDGSRQGMDGEIKLSDGLYQEDGTAINDGVVSAFTADGVESGVAGVKFSNAGLWLGFPAQSARKTESGYIDYLEKVVQNFRFADVDGDGIKDAIAKNANTGGTTYNWWKMTAGENTLGGDDTAGYNFGMPKDNPKNVGDLLGLGILISDGQNPIYSKQDVDLDNNLDIIQLAAVAAGGANAGSYKVWLGSADGTFSFAESGEPNVYMTANELLTNGILISAEHKENYAKRYLNDDTYADLIERDPIADSEDTDHNGLHKVWLGTADGTFDVTADADAYVKVTGASASGLSDSFEGSAADFQLVDIA